MPRSATVRGIIPEPHGAPPPGAAGAVRRLQADARVRGRGPTARTVPSAIVRGRAKVCNLSTSSTRRGGRRGCPRLLCVLRAARGAPRTAACRPRLQAVSPCPRLPDSPSGTPDRTHVCWNRRVYLLFMLGCLY